uniref:Uncharacterized protein n=1 Tax=Cucumis melo TaxID=3656 RepID=A0A9I9E3N0_CUCME
SSPTTADARPPWPPSISFRLQPPAADSTPLFLRFCHRRTPPSCRSSRSSDTGEPSFVAARFHPTRPGSKLTRPETASSPS